MTPQEINATIAEFCGIVSHDEHGPLYHTRAGYVRECPNYYVDLNECREAVLNLPERLQPYYMTNLFYTLIAIKKESGVSDLDKHTASPEVICTTLIKTIRT